MDKIEKNINLMKKTYKILVIVLTVLEIFTLGFFMFIFAVQAQSFDGSMEESIKFIRSLFLIGIPIIAITVDIAIYISLKNKINLISNTEPVSCVVEDFLITSYSRDHRRHYKINPVLKNVKTGELLCTFGIYNMSAYTIVQATNVNSLMAISIIRSDKSVVEIGDKVQVFIKEFVDLNVRIDSDDTYYLNNKKNKFNHGNSKYDISILNGLHFFKGFIDVEH